MAGAIPRPIRVLLILAGLALPSSAAADEWHVGADYHTGFGVHVARVAGGVQLGRLDLTALVDPLALLDGQHDLDLRGAWRRVPGGWAAFGGLRITTLGIDGGVRVQDKLLAGFEAPLPALGELRTWAGIELSVTLVEHGGGLPTEHYSLSSGRWFWETHDLGMFLRVEYASGL